MATNTNRPMGLRPVGTIGQSSYNGKIEKFYVPSTDTAGIGLGDPVKLAGGVSADGCPLATRFVTAGSDVPVGVMVGVVPLPTDLTVVHRKASTSMYILVDTDPNTIYEVQENATTLANAVAITNGTKNIPIVMGTVDTTTGNGKTLIVSTSVAATSTLDCLLLRPSPAIDNVIPGAYGKWLVKINTHQYASGAVHVGV